MADVTLTPMTEAQFAVFRATAEEGYARQIADSGATSWQDAQDKAAADYARLLPDGLATAEHHLWHAYDGETSVGVLWLHIAPKATGSEAYVYDIAVDEGLRRSGYGRAIMRAAEEECRGRGVVSIGLNVFAQNTAARRLYEQEGYELTSLQMRKRLT
ncbi:GNAT family N-acetyltransferase [Actinoplanes sp. NPDC049548]|uniref:GNAT family N-acetyltransferase n=1 Tax=Actinoplanes sp. NPDC049548 TaxID=3155152 RepID=UPI00341355AF